MGSMSKKFWRYNRDFRSQITLFLDLSKKYDLIIFDLDHTLYNEFDYLYYSYKSFLSNETIQLSEYELRLDFLMSQVAANDKRKKVFQEYTKKFQSQQSLDNFLKSLRFNSTARISLFKNTKKTIQAMSENTKIALLTNGNKEQQKNKIKLLKVDKIIAKDSIHYASDSMPKPSPNGIQRILKQFSNPKKVMLIGDSKEDEDASKNAGIAFLNINNICPKVS